MMILLPAASISTRGPMPMSNGKFQGAMLPMTPLGCANTQARPLPYRAALVLRSCGCIHSAKCSAAYWARPAIPRHSTRSASWRGCEEKSAARAS
ncbi:hypothetical protein D3C78_1722620 [compost metagenome]